LKVIAALVLIAGCFPYSDMPGDRPAPVLRKLADARILDMKVNLHKQEGLCPGTQGKLYVNGTVQWPGMQPVMRSLGNDVDSFAPSTFSITGPLIRGDAQANLFPDADVQKSIESGFETKVVYTLDPKWTFNEVFKPEYSCFTGWGENGGGGGGGSSGGGGYNGDAGRNGSPGSNGGHGEQGGGGGRVTAYVTVVSTKFYDRLLAVVANGTFFLAPADRQLAFTAIGGPGGAGGNGGEGGKGGDQPTKSVSETDENNNTTTVVIGNGPAGNGASGGNGGYGGDGGNGGVVDVTIDPAFPELRQLIVTDVGGGQGGEPGMGGEGGAGGGTNATRGAQQGGSGGPGQQGGGGRSGAPGRAAVHTGAVTTQFRNIHGITIVGTRRH